MTRITSTAAKRRRGSTVFTAAPFAGSGTSLYVNTGAAVDYRSLKTVARRPARGLPAIRKTSRAAVVYDPANSFAYSIPPAMASSVMVFDIRRFLDNVENLSTNVGLSPIELDAELEDATTIRGTATLLTPQARAGGVVRLRFRYHRSKSGLDPVSFVWARTSGPTTPANSTVSFVSGKAVYEVDTPALADSSAYTYSLTAINGSSSVGLLSGVTVQADASGPPAAILGSAEAW